MLPLEEKKGLIRGEDGKLVKSVMNIVLAFQIDDNLKNLFHYNEFNMSFEYAKDFRWPEHTKIIAAGKRIEDEDIVYIQYYLAHNKKFEISLDKLRNALIENAARKSWHPVKFYLSQLEWDGVERLDEWLIHGCGVEDNIYTRQVGRKWVTAAITRINDPGKKFDNVLVFEGEEDIGKSSILRILGGEWFTDSISLLQKETDIVAKMVGNWFIELAEMRGIRKQEQEFIKSFLSCQYDEQRLAFRRDPKKYPRQSVFAGTSNNMAYLLDVDGNRRFWPVYCTKINVQWVKNNRNQLFAEAKHIYEQGIWPENENGEKLFLEGEALRISRGQQKMRLGTDEVMEESIYKFLLDKNEVTMREILVDCFGYEKKDLTNRPQSMVIGRILKKLGFEKKERNCSDGSTFKYIREIVLNQITIQEEEY